MPAISTSQPTKFMSEMRLNRRPLTIDDAVNAGVAQSAVSGLLVLSKNTVQFRTQSFNSRTTLPIEEMGTKFHRDASPLLKGMSQKQQLALGVQSTSLHAPSIPGSADLHAPVNRVDIHECRHADRFIGGFLDHGKWKHRTLLLQLQASVDFCPQLIWRRNRGVPQGPQFTVLQCVDEIVVMSVGKRHE